MAASRLASLVTQAQVPAYVCPPGTKMHFLDLGTLEADEGWLLQGGNTSLASDQNPKSKRRELIVLAALIEYPGAWGAPLTDVFPRTGYSEKQKLPNAIKATGNDIKDVKAVVIGHLHLDHAGGLEHFMGTDTPIYVHEEEFKHACWAAGTGADLGVYLPGYLNLEKLNWRTFPDGHLDLYQGITLHHSPGHTPGLICMQINLDKSGSWIWTTDQFLVAENYELCHPIGWLARDHTAWIRSLHMIQRLQRLFNAKLIFGHDKNVASKYMVEKFYE